MSSGARTFRLPGEFSKEGDSSSQGGSPADGDLLPVSILLDQWVLEVERDRRQRLARALKLWLVHAIKEEVVPAHRDTQGTTFTQQALKDWHGFHPKLTSMFLRAGDVRKWCKSGILPPEIPVCTFLFPPKAGEAPKKAAATSDQTLQLPSSQAVQLPPDALEASTEGVLMGLIVAWLFEHGSADLWDDDDEFDAALFHKRLERQLEDSDYTLPDRAWFMQYCAEREQLQEMFQRLRLRLSRRQRRPDGHDSAETSAEA